MSEIANVMSQLSLSTGTFNWMIIAWGILILFTLGIFGFAFYIIYDFLRFNHWVFVTEKRGDKYVQYIDFGRYTRDKKGRRTFLLKKGKVYLEEPNLNYVYPADSFLNLKKAVLAYYKSASTTYTQMDLFLEGMYTYDKNGNINKDELGNPVIEKNIKMRCLENDVSLAYDIISAAKMKFAANQFLQQYGVLLISGGILILFAGVLLVTTIFLQQGIEAMSSGIASNKETMQVVVQILEKIDPSQIGGAP